MSEHSSNGLYRRENAFSSSSTRDRDPEGGGRSKRRWGWGWQRRYHDGYESQYSRKKIVWGIVLFAATLFMLWVIKQVFKEAMSKPAILDTLYNKPQQPEKVKGESKGETLCRSLACKIFGRPFVKMRPDFLRNQVTDKNLELDIFNEELRVAIEFNGEQHYKYIPFFHKNYEAFMNQRYRDEIKKMLCKQHGIHLIEISYEMQPMDIETKIKLEAYRLGLLVPQTSTDTTGIQLVNPPQPPPPPPQTLIVTPVAPSVGTAQTPVAQTPQASTPTPTPTDTPKPTPAPRKRRNTKKKVTFVDDNPTQE